MTPFAVLGLCRESRKMYPLHINLTIFVLLKCRKFKQFLPILGHKFNRAQWFFVVEFPLDAVKIMGFEALDL